MVRRHQSIDQYDGHLHPYLVRRRRLPPQVLHHVGIVQRRHQRYARQLQLADLSV